MRGCFSGNVTDRGYCANQSSVLPSDDELHPWTILPLNFSLLISNGLIFKVYKLIDDVFLFVYCALFIRIKFLQLYYQNILILFF